VRYSYRSRQAVPEHVAAEPCEQVVARRRQCMRRRLFYSPIRSVDVAGGSDLPRAWRVVERARARGGLIHSSIRDGTDVRYSYRSRQAVPVPEHVAADPCEQVVARRRQCTRRRLFYSSIRPIDVADCSNLPREWRVVDRARARGGLIHSSIRYGAGARRDGGAAAGNDGRGPCRTVRTVAGQGGGGCRLEGVACGVACSRSGLFDSPIRAGTTGGRTWYGAVGRPGVTCGEWRGDAPGAQARAHSTRGRDVLQLRSSAGLQARARIVRRRRAGVPVGRRGTVAEAGLEADRHAGHRDVLLVMQVQSVGRNR
jgi:hypothetical protein